MDAFLAAVQREAVWLWYYFMVQLDQIAEYWLLGTLAGSAVSVFAKGRIHGLFASMSGARGGLLGLIPASLLGLASPLCMYGTIPIAAAFAQRGMREDWLAAFMMSSVLLNPQLAFYSLALGQDAFLIRLVSTFLCGASAGLLVHLFWRGRNFFDLRGFGGCADHDTDPNILLRYLKNVGRNLRATGPMFFFGIVLSALFQRYVPSDVFAALFGRSNEGFGVLMAATVGVPVYVCGGGTIPLLQGWLADGMSLGAAAAFMITGPATKITNLSALKIVLPGRKFAMYIAFVIGFAFATGVIVDFAM